MQMAYANERHRPSLRIFWVRSPPSARRDWDTTHSACSRLVNYGRRDLKRNPVIKNSVTRPSARRRRDPIERRHPKMVHLKNGFNKAKRFDVYGSKENNIFF